MIFDCGARPSSVVNTAIADGVPRPYWKRMVTLLFCLFIFFGKGCFMYSDAKKALHVRACKLVKPADRAELKRWLQLILKMTVPEKGVCEGHCSPLDYLEHVFFEREGDAVVWACRGGGKTQVAAAATLLDLVFKPGIQVRILAGSEEQSMKMYGYLCGFVMKGFTEELAGKMTRKGFAMKNGSKVEILTQSEMSVRGTRVQKMRCDEVELFSEEVWRAAQLTTRSREGARGTVEVFSTMHVVGGIMAGLVGDGRGDAAMGDAAKKTRAGRSARPLR